MKEIKELISRSLKVLDLPSMDFSLEHPKDESHGDYSCNVAMVLSKQVGKNPRELATLIVEQVYKEPFFVKMFEKVEVAGPGFINFYLKQDFFTDQLKNAVDDGYGKNDNLKGQKIYVEFTDPNPFKEFHIGHLMSNTIGESLARILEASGAIVKRANYQGDVGLHVAKSIWGLQQKMEQDNMTLDDLRGDSLKERVGYLGAAYAYGAGEYETSETAKTEMNALNKEIYDGLATGTEPARTLLAGEVMELYHEGRAWSLEYFETIYARLGTKFDEYFFESEAGPVGLKSIEEGLSKGVLEMGEGDAVVFKGEKYGLHTRVFRNKLGLPTYEGKELGLPKMKNDRWKYDKSYVITANEIDEYFKVLLQVLKLLYPELGAKTVHLSHGMMKLTTGKMSSRTGKVVTGEGLLNELREVVLSKMGDPSSPKASTRQGRDVKNTEMVADQVAVGALKYSVLKQKVGGDIVYEPVKMTNLEGDTGPYIQYTYARTQSVIKKSIASHQDSPGLADLSSTKHPSISLGISLVGESWKPNTEELSILKWIYRYPETVAEAHAKYAPHMVAGYVYELATRFNTFYNQHQIVGNEFRILLTTATANIIKSGLNLLGIVAPEEM